MATSYSAQKAAEKKKYDEIYNKNIEQINKNYDAGIDDLSKKYDDQQRTVAVQKLINERKVAESMANLGVTDSGLNRTQQTAVQLSTANQAYNLNRQKQADINAYNLERDNKIAEIEQSRLSSHLSLDDKYLQLEESAKAVNGSQNNGYSNTFGIIQADGATFGRVYGELKDNNVSVIYNPANSDGEFTTTYIDKNTGKKLTVASTINPYTGHNNIVVEGRSNSATAQAGDKWGYFDNGYQPKGVDGNRKFDTTKNGYVITKGTIDLPDTGVTRRVFGVTQNGITTYWYWRAEQNKYIQVYPCDDSGREVAYKEGNIKWGKV